MKSDTGDTGWITDVTGEVVIIDFNHELAGEPIKLEVRVLDVLDSGDEGE